MLHAAEKTDTLQKSDPEEANSVRIRGDNGRVKTWYLVSNTFEFVSQV